MILFDDILRKWADSIRELENTEAKIYIAGRILENVCEHPNAKGLNLEEHQRKLNAWRLGRMNTETDFDALIADAIDASGLLYLQEFKDQQEKYFEAGRDYQRKFLKRWWDEFKKNGFWRPRS